MTDITYADFLLIRCTTTEYLLKEMKLDIIENSTILRHTKDTSRKDSFKVHHIEKYVTVWVRFRVRV